jgi:Concanavalin A-like lectin/glucanases superfamily/CARDB
MKRAFLTAVVMAASLHAITRAADQVVPGRNVNLNPGTVDQYVGDVYRQRQVESKIVCTIPQHCAVISNDYRTVDGGADLASGFGETNSSPSGALHALGALLGIKKHRSPPHQAAADAWLGLYRSTNLDDWLNGLVPGFPQDGTALGGKQPWNVYAAASDGDLGTDGTYIYGVGMFFNRGGASMIGAFRLTDFNDESAVPIRWSDNSERVIDRRDTLATTSFLDLPSIAVDPMPRGDSVNGCGHVYIGYTAFTGSAGDSSIKVVRSKDCGASYSAPVSVNVIPGTSTPVFRKNQRVVFAVNPRPGTPLTTGGGTVYAVWRSFSPDMIVGTASFDFGKTWLPPVPYSVFNGVNTICAYDQPTVGSTTDLGLYANDTARAVAFPTMTIDSAGKLYLAWSERVDANGNAVMPKACNASLQPKIVLTTSTTLGLTWTSRRAIDMGTRCETTAADGRPGGLDQPSDATGACPAGTLSRRSGPQIQPVISHNAGKVMLIYSEGRGGLNTNLGPSNGFHAGRDRQMDVRAAQINPATNALLSTTQVSVYIYSAATNDIKPRDGAVNPPGAKAINLPYLLQYSGGTNPFKGDHDGLAGAEPVVWDTAPRPPTAADQPGTRFVGVWGGDNREAFFPAGDLFNTSGWTVYQDAVNFPNSCNAGIRNSNDYLSSIGGTTEAFVYQSFKPTDTLQRTWVVTVRNRRNVTGVYKFALEEPGGDGSFDQSFDQPGGNNVNVIGNTPGDAFCQAQNATYPTCTSYRRILPYSSQTFTVFGRISNSAIGGPIRVDVFEASLDSTGLVVTNERLAAIVRLNPNPNNPTSVLADPTAGNSEFHDPTVTGPTVTTNQNPGPGNPGPGNTTLSFPGPGNPGPGNPGPGNPGPGNPGPGNAGLTDYTDYTYQVTATGANTTSQFASFADIASAGEVDKSHFIQMFITRLHTVPTLEQTATGCTPAERNEDQLISLINLQTASDLKVPGPGNPGPGNPGPGNTTAYNPGPGNPGPGNPGPGNPGPGNNTFAVSAANVSLAAGGSAAFRAAAVASATATTVSDQAADVGPDGTLIGRGRADKVFVTVRFYHCNAPNATDPATGMPACGYNGRFYAKDVVETVPKTAGADANHLISLTTAPAAGDNNNGTITPPQNVVVGQDLLIVDSAISATPGSGLPGSTTQISGFTIKNAGAADAGPFTYRYFLVSGETETPLTPSLGFGEGPTGLAAGATVSIPARNVTIPSNASVGPKLIRVRIDDTNAVQETDESNNSRDAAFTVVGSGFLFVGTDFEEFTDSPPPDHLRRISMSGVVINSTTLLTTNFPVNGIASSGTFLFAGDAETNNFRHIDFDGNLLSGPVAGGFPNACCNEDMAFDGTTLYHAHYGSIESGSIDKIDLNTGQVLAGGHYDLPFGPVGITFVGSQIWISNWDAKSVGTWDPLTNTYTPVFTVGSNAGGLAYDSANGILWVGRQGGCVEPYDLSGNVLGSGDSACAGGGFQPFGDLGLETIDGLEFVPATAGSAMNFDGVNDFVNVPDSGSLDLSDFTLESWVKIDGPGFFRYPVISKGSDNFGNYALSILGNQTQAVPGTIEYVQKAQPPYGNYSCGGGPITFGQWNHIAVSVSGDTVHVYLNGALVRTCDSTNSPAPPRTTNAEPLFLGRLTFGPGADEWFGGLVDEVRIWNVARSGADIGANYNHAVNPSTGGLVGYWKFDEAFSDQNVIDSSPFGNNGTRGADSGTASDDPIRVPSSAPIIP